MEDKTSQKHQKEAKEVQEWFPRGRLRRILIQPLIKK
jgi:hypothetical protein